jgi:AraC-like DNA-binding protein
MTAPPIEIIDHASPYGRWTLWRRQPAAALRGWLLDYCGYLEVGGRPVRRRELPSPVVPLILNLGAPWVSYDPDRPERARWLRRSFTAGLHRRHALVGSTGEALCLQVDMTPLAARRLFGLPMADLTDAVVEVDDLPGSWLGELVDRLAETPVWADRFVLLDRVFTDRLARAPRPTPRAVRAWWILRQSRGAASITAVALDLEVSRAQLHRLMIDSVGLSPKTVARLCRFEAAIEALQRGEPLAELAVGAGFFDQPHFNRECLAFAGESPSALRRRLLADGTGVMDEAM